MASNNSIKTYEEHDFMGNNTNIGAISVSYEYQANMFNSARITIYKVYTSISEDKLNRILDNYYLIDSFLEQLPKHVFRAIIKTHNPQNYNEMIITKVSYERSSRSAIDSIGNKVDIPVIEFVHDVEIT